MKFNENMGGRSVSCLTTSARTANLWSDWMTVPVGCTKARVALEVLSPGSGNLIVAIQYASPSRYGTIADLGFNLIPLADSMQTYYADLNVNATKGVVGPFLFMVDHSAATGGWSYSLTVTFA